MREEDAQGRQPDDAHSSTTGAPRGQNKDTGGVPLDSHSIRFPADVWAAIVVNARHVGVSPSAFVRIGALSYAAYVAARRGDEVTERFDALWGAARDLLDTYDLDEP